MGTYVQLYRQLHVEQTDWDRVVVQDKKVLLKIRKIKKICVFTSYFM